MKQVGHRGFTLVEVMFFFAIATFMIIIAARAIGSRNTVIQFTDSMRAVEAYLERKQSEIRAGFAERSGGCTWNASSGYTFGLGSDGSCIFLGYLFEFGDYNQPPGTDERGILTVHQVVGARLNTAQMNNCTAPPTGKSAIACSSPTLSGVSEEFVIPWGSEVFGADYDNQSAIGLGLIREPNSTSVIPMILLDGADLTNPALFDHSLSGTPGSVIGAEEQAAYCFMTADSSMQAAILFADSFREESFELLFDIADDFPSVCSESGRFNGNL